MLNEPEYTLLANHHEGDSSFAVLFDSLATWDIPGTADLVAVHVARDPMWAAFDFDTAALPMVGLAQQWHRDFYGNYGPAQFYMSSTVVQTVRSVGDGGTALGFPHQGGDRDLELCGGALRVAQAAAFAVYIACLIWLAAVGSPGFPLFPALLFSLAAAAAGGVERGQSLAAQADRGGRRMRRLDGAVPLRRRRPGGRRA